MKEEVGIDIEKPVFLGWGQDNDFNHRSGRSAPRLLMFFHVKTSQKINVDPDEAEKHKWVSFDEMKGVENKEGGLTDFLKRNPRLKF